MQWFNNVIFSSNGSTTIVQLAMMFSVSLVLGILFAAVYKYNSHYTKEFVITLSLLPMLIAVIISLVNGNLGTSVAVAGTFSLIKFRSAAGSSKEMLAVLVAMAIGLATGMGYFGLAILMTSLISICIVLFENSHFVQVNQHRRHLLLTVPVAFDYNHLFEKELGTSCHQSELLSIKYQRKKQTLILEYHVLLDDHTSDKVLVDKLLAAGSLDIVLNKQLPKRKFL
ncbi:DUF4956 domain-containing protein [Streptococcus suis]|nr:DUF4956 domain-containing protein [Streptococcus suis]